MKKKFFFHLYVPLIKESYLIDSFTIKGIISKEYFSKYDKTCGKSRIWKSTCDIDGQESQKTKYFINTFTQIFFLFERISLIRFRLKDINCFVHLLFVFLLFSDPLSAGLDIFLLPLCAPTCHSFFVVWRFDFMMCVR